jgi:hypothetical protein
MVALRLRLPFVSLLALAPVAVSLRAQSPTRAVRVTGSVHDSLTGAPLSSASIRFAREDDPAASRAAARTDAEGRYEISLSPGRWLAGIEHPHLDSLGVTLPIRRVEIPEKSSFKVALATASARTLARAYCGDRARDEEAFVVGTVQAAGSGEPIDSASVFVQWSNLRFARGGVVVSTPTILARTDKNGWYVLCGLPKRAALVGWAERGSAATGLVEAQSSDGPMRLDLWIDPRSTLSARDRDSADVAGSARDSTRNRPAVRSGSVRFRAQMTDASGRPIAGARARIVGHRFAIGDENGYVVLDSLPGGSQTLEVRALGFVPFMKPVHLSAVNAAPDTIALTSVKALLDTVRITAGRVYAADGTGFEARRKSGIGSYVTRMEIDRLHPPSFVSLMQGRSAFNIMDDPNGDQHITMKAPWGGDCSPAVWVDGDLIVYPSGPTAGAFMAAPLAKGGGSGSSDAQGNAVNPSAGNNIAPSTTPKEPVGILELNWLVRPEEIEGVELYRRPMEIPARFTTGGFQGCGAIVIWTRWRLTLPQSPPPPRS